MAEPAAIGCGKKEYKNFGAALKKIGAPTVPRKKMEKLIFNRFSILCIFHVNMNTFEEKIQKTFFCVNIEKKSTKKIEGLYIFF